MEFALKACLAKQVKAEDFPDKEVVPKWWTHRIEELVVSAGLKKERDSDSQNDPDLDANWVTAKDWKESIRYEFKTKAEAQDLYDAVTDPKHGVLPWIALRW